MGQFIVSTIVFLVIVFLIMRYVWPLLKTSMAKRQEEIGHALAAAEAARADAASAEEDRQNALAEGKAQAAEIVAGARRSAEQIAAESAGRAQIEYDRIVANAANEVTLARQRAVDEAAARLGAAVMGVVEKVIDREVDALAHDSLVNDAVGAITATVGQEGTGFDR